MRSLKRPEGRAPVRSVAAVEFEFIRVHPWLNRNGKEFFQAASGSLELEFWRLGFRHLADAQQILFSADEQMALRNGDRRLHFFAERIFCEHFELRTRLDNRGFAVVAVEINFFLSRNHSVGGGPPHRRGGTTAENPLLW